MTSTAIRADNDIKPFLGPQNMAHFHQMVVHHHGQMVGGKTVRLEDYKVLQQMVLPLHFAPD